MWSAWESDWKGMNSGDEMKVTSDEKEAVVVFLVTRYFHLVTTEKTNRSQMTDCGSIDSNSAE